MRDSVSDLSTRHSEADIGKEEKLEKHESQNALTGKVSALISSCRICLSGIFKPAALSCGHQFCEKCLDQYWRIREKPACIVCPLCRACAFNVNFVKQGKSPSTEDFRRTFSPIIVNDVDINRAITWCIRVSVFMPALYFLFKWLSPTLSQLASVLYFKFTNNI